MLHLMQAQSRAPEFCLRITDVPSQLTNRADGVSTAPLQTRTRNHRCISPHGVYRDLHLNHLNSILFFLALVPPPYRR